MEDKAHRLTDEKLEEMAATLKVQNKNEPQQ